MHITMPFHRLLNIRKLGLHIIRQMTSFTNEIGADKRLVWVDLEMTGLDVDRDYILEMSCIITDPELNVITEGLTVAIKQPDRILENMNEWCQKHHTESGLVARCKASNIYTPQAENMMLELIESCTPKGKCVLAGNSVHEDRRFLAKHMPRIINHLHYRIVDVSTIKELCRRWYPTEFLGQPKKMLKHRALDDILESIQELKYYKSTIFKPRGSTID
ncbi:probable oligoribonuclease [Artemia franciscana]|uniref:probable oligoribonuclease n=1 Tax=Artemia franciscana TaxID=6661 RepID=UPI0032DB0344